MIKPTLLNNRYKVIQVLASGGFGKTFLAEDMQMPSLRKCVIKQLIPLEQDPKIYKLVQERFQREAAILEKLSDSQNQIPQLYAYFTYQERFYLVQEYIEGETLTTKLQRGILSENLVKEILINILPVLSYIHNKRIVHRDIKPDNILIRSLDNQPVLIDFGAVKESMQTVLTISKNCTTSIVIGTPGFMPSEQTAGRPVYSSDLYSLGLTAIYLLTGKIPQELPNNPSTGEIIWKEFAQNISPNFAAVLDKAIKSHPQERFISAKEMLKVLRPQLVAIPPIARNPKLSVTGNLEVSTINSTPSHYIKTQPSTLLTNQGMRDWQKSTIIGSVIGFFIFSSMVIFNKKPATSIQAETNLTQTKTLTKADSSTNKSDSVKTLENSMLQASTQNQVNHENILSKTNNLPTHKSVANLPNTQIFTKRQSARQTVKNYYLAINNQQHKRAWNYLSIQNKNNSKSHPNGFNSFTDWWVRVSKVEIQKITVQNINNERAIVNSKLYYSIKSGRTISQSLRFILVWDVLSETWLINKVEKI